MRDAVLSRPSCETEVRVQPLLEFSPGDERPFPGARSSFPSNTSSFIASRRVYPADVSVRQSSSSFGELAAFLPFRGFDFSLQVFGHLHVQGKPGLFWKASPYRSSSRLLPRQRVMPKGIDGQPLPDQTPYFLLAETSNQTARTSISPLTMYW